MIYELYYWPGIQGRGEFVRLALEEAGAEYLDIALLPEERGGGVLAMMKFLDAPAVERPPFAPPFLTTKLAPIAPRRGGRRGLELT